MRRVREWSGGPLGLIILSWDTFVGVLVAGATFLLLDPANELTALPLAILGAGATLVAVLATVITLLNVLLDAEVLVPLLERLGGRERQLQPFWFHGYVAAATVVLSLVAAAAPWSAARWIVPVSCGTLAWSSVAMIDFVRHTMELSSHKRRLEESAERFRRRNSA